jgi:hypothetical protein
VSHHSFRGDCNPLVNTFTIKLRSPVFDPVLQDFIIGAFRDKKRNDWPSLSSRGWH